VRFFAIDGSGVKGDLPFHNFDWVRREPVAELEEPVAGHHSEILAKSESPDMLMGYMGDGMNLFVILPMKGTAEQWVNMFWRAGVEIAPTPEWAEWNTASWNQEERDRLTATLEADEVPHVWRGEILRSGVQNTEAVLDVFAKLGVT
jgi:hypothetical protein